MSIETPPCGVHCGIASGREGHCDCALCHNGSAPAFREDAARPRSGWVSMCDQWYAGISDYRPWYGHADNRCSCGKPVHYRPEDHDEHCLVRQENNRARVLDELASTIRRETGGP